MAFYRCPYILRNGKICNQGCYRPEGCKVHWNSPLRIPCKEYGCVKLTYSDYGYCDSHAQKHRKREYKHQKKLEKMAQKSEVLGENT